jgi:hypothetical protein
MRPLLLLSLGLLSACYSDYMFTPTQKVSATVNGLPASRYEVPPEQPRGVVTVATFGIQRLDLGSGEQRFLLVRMTIDNNNDFGPWNVDTRQLYVALPGEGRSLAAYVNTDRQGLPTILIPPGHERVIDLFFPLPVGLQHASRIPGFDFSWQVQTASRAFAERTPFERVELAPTYAGYGLGYGLGWGPYWWYDPFYPTATFVHPIPIQRAVGVRPFIAAARAPRNG